MLSPSFESTQNLQALSTFEVEHGFAQAETPSKRHVDENGRLWQFFNG
jgi:hypothetical protein